VKIVLGENPDLQMTPACRGGERFRICEVPKGGHFYTHPGLADAITSDQTFTVAKAVELLRNIGNRMGTFDHAAAVQLSSSG
jgi:hypothetical protein